MDFKELFFGTMPDDRLEDTIKGGLMGLRDFYCINMGYNYEQFEALKSEVYSKTRSSQPAPSSRRDELMMWMKIIDTLEDNIRCDERLKVLRENDVKITSKYEKYRGLDDMSKQYIAKGIIDSIEEAYYVFGIPYDAAESLANAYQLFADNVVISDNFTQGESQGDIDLKVADVLTKQFGIRLDYHRFGLSLVQ